ncbi:hypothetical protein MIB92_18015 [Aestuariirhabdus sp. Z084]|nr:hypothetical protein [Aestuariirhabdus haliotis]
MPSARYLSFATPTLVRTMIVSLMIGASGYARGANDSVDDNLLLVTAVPVIFSMVEDLTRDTSIDVSYLPPDNYSIKRIPGWLNRTSPDDYPRADVVVGMTSVWPDVDPYPALRLRNIGVIYIDAAQALVPGGERVAITSGHSTDDLEYFWLNPANALVMLGIIQRDLESVVSQGHFNPERKAAQIQILKNNYQQIGAQLRSMQLTLGQKLMNFQVMQVVADKGELYGLAAATLLPIVDSNQATVEGVTTLYLTSKKPGHKQLRGLDKSFLIWHIDDFGKLREGSFTQRWQAMIEGLSQRVDH